MTSCIHNVSCFYICTECEGEQYQLNWVVAEIIAEEATRKTNDLEIEHYLQNHSQENSSIPSLSNKAVKKEENSSYCVAVFVFGIAIAMLPILSGMFREN